MEGWIKLHRKVLDHWLYSEQRPLTKREAWETILLTVNYSTEKVLIKGQLYDCKPGQSLLSLDSWAKKFMWSIQQVRTFFKILEKDGMITTEGLQYSTRLTVCKWDTYQQDVTDQQQAANKPLTNQQQAANKPLTTIKEEEEREERKEGEKRKEAQEPVMTWRDDFQIYLSELRVAYNQLIHDPDWMAEKQKFHPGVNIKLSLEKACVEFWATEAGWKNKKALRTKIIDWKATLTNAISLKSNKVYESKPAANNNRKELENLRELSERVLQEFTSNNNP